MGTNPSHFQNNPQNPVEKVSWDDAQAFCQKLSQITGKTYGLPTEAESKNGDRSGDGDGSASAFGSASTSAPVARVETAYLVYSQGLWLVTTGISPRSLASSPLLLTWGTSDFIASDWRELTPYKPSSEGDTARKTRGQGHLGVPLDILLHTIAHLRPDPYPAATAAGNDSNNQSLAWALSTVSSLAVHQTSPVLEQHSMLSHEGTLSFTCADTPNVLRAYTLVHRYGHVVREVIHSNLACE